MQSNKQPRATAKNTTATRTTNKTKKEHGRIQTASCLPGSAGALVSRTGPLHQLWIDLRGIVSRGRRAGAPHPCLNSHREQARNNLEGSALGPEVERMQAREENSAFTTCDKCYGGSIRKRQDAGKAEAGRCKQRAGNTRATQMKQALTTGKCRSQGRMRKHKETVAHCEKWLMKPLQQRLRIM